MSSRHRNVASHSNTPSENENASNSNQTENYIELSPDQTYVEPKKNTNDKTPQNPLQILESSLSEIFNGQARNPSVKMRQQFFGNM